MKLDFTQERDGLMDLKLVRYLNMLQPIELLLVQI